MKQRLLATLLSLIMIIGLIPISALAEDIPTGTITQGCMSTVTEDRVRLTGELTVTSTGETLEVRLYSGETHIATSTLINEAYIGKTNQTLSWNFVISGEASSSWKTVWEDGMPRSDYEPTNVALYIDGQKIAENTVTMYKNNDKVPGEEYVWAELVGVTVIPTGTITQGCMSTVTEDKVRLTGELTVTSTGETLEVRLYSGETHIATSTLINEAYIGKTNQTLSWNFVISGEASSSWKTVWEDGMPRSDYEPTNVALYIDGQKIAENTVTMYKNNDKVPGEEYVWAELDGVTVISLVGLVLSTGELSPDFDPSITEYTVSVSNSTRGISITPMLANGYTAMVNGVAVASGSASDMISLKVGSNTITVTVVDEHDNSTIYTITVTRKYSSNPGGNLSSYTLTFNVNGGTDISSITRVSGTTIDLTDYVPTREGFIFDGWYSDKWLSNEISSVRLTKNTTVYAGWTEIKETPNPIVNPFKDVFPSDWYYEDVMYAYINDLMNGTATDVFSPAMTTTRGMIVTILYRLEGEPSTYGLDNPFTDLTQDWYVDAVKWAAANSIVEGYGNGLYGPEDPITREQMVTILWRYAKYKGVDVSSGNNMNIEGYNDDEGISSYALPAVQWAVAEGIIQGDGGNLMPTASAPRCQIAAILHRYCLLIEA